MSFLDRLLGRPGPQEQDQYEDRGVRRGPQRALTPDEQALERYRYMLRTAPPDDIERAHEEAFAALSAEQRREVLLELSAQVPESERRMASDDPRGLARLATRAEMREPGTIERTFSNMGLRGGQQQQGGAQMGGSMGMGFGSILLTSLAASFVGTAIAQSFFASHPYPGDAGGADAAAGEDGYGEGDQGAEGDYGGDTAGGDTAGGDYGGTEAGVGDYGGDFGGGDFGGGDFGGGDFGGF